MKESVHYHSLKTKSRRSLGLMFYLLLIFPILINSCQTEDEDNLTTQINTLKFNFSEYSSLKSRKSFNLVKDNLSYIKNTNELLDLSQISLRSDEDNIANITISTAIIDQNNLNSIFSSLPDTINILCVTLIKDDNDLSKGLMIHYLESDESVKLRIYEKEENSELYNLIEFPAKEVTNFTLDNVLFVAKNLFPELNIESLAVSSIDEQVSNSKYDDFLLLSFGARYHLSEDPSLTEGGSRPCATAVHTCRNGSETNTECAPAGGGCRQPASEGCSKNTSLQAFISLQMQEEHDIVSSDLPDDNLYETRNWLNLRPKGKMYTEAYYSISSHFKESIDIDLLYKISNSSSKISEFIDAFLSDDPNYILTEETYSSIIDIAQSSANKSESLIYKNLIEKLIEETEQYKSKNVLQIKYLINQS